MIRGVCIAIPTRGDLRIETALSLCGVISKLVGQHVPHAVKYYSSADIVLSRNRLACGFLADEKYSHILFIDSDMGFNPDVFDKLAKIDVPFAACAYPKRALDMEKLRREIEAEAGKPLDDRATMSQILSRVANFTFRPFDFDGRPWRFETRGSYLSVAAVGFGLALISRDVFTKMVEVGCVDRVLPDGENYPASSSYGYFNPVPREDGLGWLSEDYSFCQRWVVSCGGKIWVDQASTIQHVGDFQYSASLLEHLQSIKKTALGTDSE